MSTNYNLKTRIINSSNSSEIIYFDYCSDTSSASSSEVSDQPIDARRGATLQDKKTVNMKTVGISGKFRNYTTDKNSYFKNSQNRIGSIISYFENALNEEKIYTVKKNGVVYNNMLLSKVDVSFDESISTVAISLSFIEANIIKLRARIEDNESPNYSYSVTYLKKQVIKDDKVLLSIVKE